MYLWCLRPYTRQCVIREMIRNGVEAHTNRKTHSAVTGVAGVPEGRGRMQKGDPYLGREGTVQLQDFPELSQAGVEAPRGGHD